MINERYITSKGSEIMMMIIIILKDNEKNKKKPRDRDSNFKICNFKKY